MPRPILRAALLGALLTASACAQTAPAHPQWRGLWVDAFGPGLKTPEQVTKLVADARALHLNVLFAQVGRRMDCYCTTASVSRTEDPEVPAGFDPLADLIAKAHAANIQVHAWMITTAAWNSAKPPKDPNHVFNLHGPSRTGADMWMTVKNDGTLKSGADWVLDPAVPGAEAYIADMYASVVRNYDVDGIMLDRVRYPDSGTPGLAAWGYNPVTLARYAAETGRAGTPDPRDPAWTDWRRTQVSHMVRRIALEVKKVRPSVWVDAATITYGQGPGGLTSDEPNSGSTVPGGARSGQPMAWTVSRPYTEVLQDWAGWLRAGELDASVMMNYKRDFVPAQADWYRHWNSFGARSKALGRVIAGSAVYLNPQANSTDQARQALAAGLDGWAAYSYRTPDPDVNASKRSYEQVLPELTARLAGPGGPFESPAPTLDRPDTGHLRAVEGRVMKGDRPLSGVTVHLLSDGTEAARTTTDANGGYGFFYPPLETFTVQVDGAGPVSGESVAGAVTDLPDLVVP